VIVLLRRAHGFERFGKAVEHAQQDAFPASPPGDLPWRLIEGSATTCAMAASAHGSDRQVSKIAHFENLDAVVGPGVEQGHPPAPHSFVPAIAALDGGDARDALHVTVHQLQVGIEIASVVSVHHSVVKVHVLL
jgi:hypothetical protein